MRIGTCFRSGSSAHLGVIAKPQPQIAQILDGLQVTTSVIRDGRMLADPQAAVDAQADVLGKLAMQLGAINANLGICTN